MPFIDRSYFVGEIGIPQTNADINAALDLMIQTREDELLTHLLGYQFKKAFLTGLQGSPIDPMWTNLLQGVEWTDDAGRLRKWIGFISFPVDTVSAIQAANSISVVVGRGNIGDPVAGASITTIPASLVGASFIIEQRLVGQLRTDEYTVVGNQLTLLGGKTFSLGDTYFYKSVTLALNTTTGTNKKSLIANYVYFRFQQNNITQTLGIGEISNVSENAIKVSPRHKMTRAWNEMVDWIRELYAFLWQNSTIYTDWLPYAWAYNWTPNYYPETTYYRKINAFGI